MRTFPEELKLLLKSRKISASVAALELGYSSKTALLRILNGKSKPSSYRKCFDAILASPIIALTHEERMNLQRALQISTMGPQEYALNSSLQNLLYPQKIDDRPQDIPLSGLEEMTTVEELITRVSAFRGLEISLFGKCPPELLARLSRFAQTADVSSITHIIAVQRNNADDFISVGETSHIIFNERYSLFIYIERVEITTWAFHSGMIFFTGEDSAGKKHTYFIAPLPSSGYYAVYDRNGSILQFKDRILQESEPFIFPIKRTRNYNRHPFPINYINFTNEYRKIENNREIYTIKPDIPFYSISPDLLYPIILEAFSSIDPFIKTNPSVPELYEIQKARYENLLHKSKVSHFVLKQSAMEDFARTGRLQDHLFILRPFTPQERVAILSAIANAMTENPMFNIWFSRYPYLFADMEVTAYETHSLAIIDAKTSWNLHSSHQEILLEGKALSSSFRNLVNQLVSDGSVFPREESLRILRDLIEIAANA